MSEFLQCPYDPVHRFAKKSMTSHLNKCRKNFPTSNFETCKFNSSHRVPQPELAFHMEQCPDRIYPERQLEQESPAGIGVVPEDRIASWTQFSEYDEDDDWAPVEGGDQVVRGVLAQGYNPSATADSGAPNVQVSAIGNSQPRIPFTQPRVLGGAIPRTENDNQSTFMGRGAFVKSGSQVSAARGRGRAVPPVGRGRSRSVPASSASSTSSTEAAATSQILMQLGRGRGIVRHDFSACSDDFENFS